MKEIVKNSALLRAIVLPAHRARIVAGYMLPQFRHALSWLLTSKETTNFTYDLTQKNKDYLCATLSVVTGVPMSTLSGYLSEIEENESLRRHVAEATKSSDLAYQADAVARFHKRIGWYALTRALKPKVVVETGVDKGLGSVVLCTDLLQNQKEGHSGHYYGTDLNPKAGYLLCGKYSDVGEILYGDSVESLRALKQPVDLFINDSDHSADYEALEYETIAGKLSSGAVILGDNSHVTDKLMRFSTSQNRNFLFWQEEPMEHWYPGGGIGMSWKP